MDESFEIAPRQNVQSGLGVHDALGEPRLVNQGIVVTDRLAFRSCAEIVVLDRQELE